MSTGIATRRLTVSAFGRFTSLHFTFWATGPPKESLHIMTGPHPHKPQVGPAGIAHSELVSLPVDLVPGPGPRDYRVLRLERQEVPKGFPVAVPELLAGHGSPQRAAHDLPHDHRARKVQPDDRVGAGPDQILNGAVVTIDDPAVASRMLAHPGAEGVGIERLPVSLVMDRIELKAGDSEHRGDPPRQPCLARPGVAHDRHPAHVRGWYRPDRSGACQPSSPSCSSSSSTSGRFIRTSRDLLPW